MTEHECRACSGQSGHVVLDLGKQPACDHFPKYDDLGPDPVYPLQMWLCSDCGLAQLLEDPTVPEEPRGTEPAALIAQAEDAVARVAAAGLLPPGARVAEYGSPHGGSWLGLLSRRGLIPVTGSMQADIICDSFGMMHAADQAAAVAERAARLAPGGVLLLQYHSLHTIVAARQWNALRHGHYAYYSTTALTKLLGAAGLALRMSWRFALYGGTVLLAARREADDHGGPDESVMVLLAAEAGARIRDPRAVGSLQRDVSAHADALREWLMARRRNGQTVIGYSAASRAVALLRLAGVDRDLLPAVADASPTKHGLRMPGTGIEIISPREMIARSPDAVLLFVPDLMPEVRETYPEIESSGARWISADALEYSGRKSPSDR